MKAPQLKAIFPLEIAAEFKTGRGTVCTLTSSSPKAPGSLLKSNSSAVLAAVAGTTNCRLVQPKAFRLVRA